MFEFLDVVIVYAGEPVEALAACWRAGPQTDRRQSCTAANRGFGVALRSHYKRCEGSGFLYAINWAKTCICKKR